MEFQNNQIIDLKTRSMECNAIITGLNENQNENLPLLVQNVFTQDHEMQESEVNNVGIIKLYKEIQRQIERFQDQYLFNLTPKRNNQEFQS